MSDFKFSYSTLSSYLNCPRAFAAKSIYKTIKFTQNEAAAWGSSCHSAFEHFFKEGKPLEGRFEFLKPTAEQVSKAANGANIEAEKEMGITADKQPCSFWDGRLRGKLDLFWKFDDKAVVTDWKIAKYDPSRYNLELDCFKLLTYHNNPEVQKIKTALIWLKEEVKGPPTIKMSDRSELPQLEDSIFSKIEMVDDAIDNKRFPPKRSGLCQKFCDLMECEHNGKNKR